MTDYPLDKIMKHKRTMLLLDRVVSHTDNIVVAEVTISPASTFFHDTSLRGLDWNMRRKPLRPFQAFGPWKIMVKARWGFY